MTNPMIAFAGLLRWLFAGSVCFWVFMLNLPLTGAIGSDSWQGVAVSYNIRHGEGMDGKLDLERTASVLKRLNADFVGLQEVDNGARRSGSVEQPAFLAEQLGMKQAFGKFMDYDGGQYGLAILSKHPILKTEIIELPQGNEPRVALATLVQLPNEQQLTVVNLHFDWVKDDSFRFAQASHLKERLDMLETPYLLLGDFNDQPGSRTINLLSQNAVEAKKPMTNRFTFPANKPNIEIDFIFGSPQKRWQFLETKVIEEIVASDHRPILTTFRLQLTN